MVSLKYQKRYNSLHYKQNSKKVTIFKSPVIDLAKQLREDKGYYIAWQANIVMAFKDEHYRQHGITSKRKIHNIANRAAESFLNLLISETGDEYEINNR